MMEVKVPRAIVILSVWGGFLLGSGLFLPEHSAYAANTQLCKEYFKKKQYVRASQCFRGLAGVLEKKPTLKVQDRSQLSQYLRNASLCLRRAAKREPSAIKKSYLYEQALSYVSLMIKKKYYEGASQKNLANLLKGRIQEKIGYILVTITTGSTKAIAKFSGGYRFKSLTKKGITFQQKLRPGNYTVVITYPKQTPQVKVLQLRPGQAAAVFTFKPKPAQVAIRPRSLVRVHPVQPPKSAGTMPWILTGVGAALVVGGGVLVGVAIGTNSTNNERADKALIAFNQQQPLDGKLVTATQTKSFKDSYQTANSLYTVGWIAGGAGLVTVAVGLIVYATQPKPKASALAQPSNVLVSFSLTTQP